MTTAGLARMNMILHDFPTATIVSGNTLAAPKFRDRERLRTLRLRGRQSAVLRQDLDDRFDAGNGPVSALCLGRTARQAGRLRLPAAHRPLDERRRGRAPASCRTACCSAVNAEATDPRAASASPAI